MRCDDVRILYLQWRSNSSGGDPVKSEVCLYFRDIKFHSRETVSPRTHDSPPYSGHLFLVQPDGAKLHHTPTNCPLKHKVTATRLGPEQAMRNDKVRQLPGHPPYLLAIFNTHPPRNNHETTSPTYFSSNIARLFFVVSDINEPTSVSHFSNISVRPWVNTGRDSSILSIALSFPRSSRTEKYWKTGGGEPGTAGICWKRWMVAAVRRSPATTDAGMNGGKVKSRTGLQSYCTGLNVWSSKPNEPQS